MPTTRVLDPKESSFVELFKRLLSIGALGYSSPDIASTGEGVTNSSLISSILAAGGKVSLTERGTYPLATWPSAPVSTEFYLGPGVVLTDGTTTLKGPRTLTYRDMRESPWRDSAVVRPFDMLAGNGVAFAQENCAGVPWCQSNVARDALGNQYIIFWGYSSGQKMTIGMRALPTPGELLTTHTAGVWTTFDATALLLTGGVTSHNQDEHNSASIHVTTDGYVWANVVEHDAGLHLIRSDTPNSVAAFSAATSLVDAGGSEFTYVAFFRARGISFMTYRNGAAGDGGWLLKRYNPTSGHWESVQALLVEGQTSNVSYYPNRWAVDRDGNIHTIGTWRVGSDNTDIVYAYSPDLGVTWYDHTNAQLAVPLTKSAWPVLYVVAATSPSYFGNQSGMDVAVDGTVYAAWNVSQDAGTTVQRRVVSGRAGGTWQSAFIEPVATGGLTPVENYSRPSLICPDNGRAYLLLASRFWYPHGILLQDITDILNPGAPAQLVDMDNYWWEPNFDSDALREHNSLDMLLVAERNSNEALGGIGSDYWTNGTGSSWFKQRPWVICFNLSHVDKIMERRLRPPRIEILFTTSLMGSATAINVTSTGFVDVGLVIPLDGAAWIKDAQGLVYQLEADMQQNTGGTGTLAVYENQYAGTGAGAGTNEMLAVDFASGRSVRRGPWSCFSRTAAAGKFYALSARAKVSANNMDIRAMVLRVGRVVFE